MAPRDWIITAVLIVIGVFLARWIIKGARRKNGKKRKSRKRVPKRKK